MSDVPPATDSWSRILTAQTGCMILALKLRPKYGDLVDGYVDLGILYADAPIQIRARAQEDRLQILKRLEAQAAPDAVVSESPDVQNPQNKRPISEPALHTPDMQDLQNKRPMSEPSYDAAAKRHCVSRSAPPEGMPNADWVFRVGTEEKRAHHHRPYLQFCLQQIKSTRSPCSNKELAKAYNAAYGEGRVHYPTLLQRRPDWLITMWSAANVRVQHASRQMRTLRSGWRQIRPILVELLTAWLREKPLMDKEIVTEAELLDAAVEHIHKSSVGRPGLAHWPSHGPDIDRDCLNHAITGCALLREWSKIKQNPDTCVCFDLPSCGRTRRGRVVWANSPRAEIEEVGSFADPQPPSSPAEDAAADALAAPDNEGAQCPLQRAPPTAPSAPSPPVPAAAGAAAEPPLANASIALPAPAAKAEEAERYVKGD